MLDPTKKRYPTSKGKSEATTRWWKVKLLNRVWLFVTPWTVTFQGQWDFPGKNTGVGCHFLLQIFPAQGSNPGIPHCRQILPSEPPGKPNKMERGAKSCLGLNFIPTREAERVQTKPGVHQDPRKGAVTSTRDLGRLACECPRISSGGVGQHWPAAGPVARNTTVLG